MYKLKIFSLFFQLILFSFIISYNLFAQIPLPSTSAISHSGKVQLKKISKLPLALKECSGIIAINNNRIWAINDGGNSPILYCMDSTGKIINSVEVRGSKNIDWEDITSDGKNFYIGDFGNNMNNRLSFQIYKIPVPDSANYGFIDAEKIEFSYEDLKVPVPSNKLYYDVESLIVLKDTIYLFSKNRTRPFNGKVYIYKLPINSPTKIATKYDSLYLGSGKMIDFWISSAALSPDKNQLVLISYSKMWIFNCIKGSFFNATITSLNFDFTSQKESISFVDQHNLYLTDEKNFPFSEGALYSLNIENYLIKDCK